MQNKKDQRMKIKAKYDDIYVLLYSNLPLFALRKYTQSCNGLLVKLEANNERVYYSYHPRVCERASERVSEGRTRRRPSEAREGKRKESRGEMQFSGDHFNFCPLQSSFPTPER